MSLSLSDHVKSVNVVEVQWVSKQSWWPHWMSSLLLGFMQFIQMIMDEHAVIEFTTCWNNWKLVWNQTNLRGDPPDVVDHFFHYRSPTLGAKFVAWFCYFKCSCKAHVWKETNLVILVLILYSVLNKTLKNIILRRKVYAVNLIYTVVINKNPVYNLLFKSNFCWYLLL